jgi:hypothetical protein
MFVLTEFPAILLQKMAAIHFCSSSETATWKKQGIFKALMVT